MWLTVVLVTIVFNACYAHNSNDVSNDIITDDIPQTRRHHKVHNLILTPDQHSWCEPKQIRQIVTHAKCQSEEIENYVCVGTCFSYSVPQTDPETPGDEMLDYCDSCQPAESYWNTVVLECEDDDGVQYKVAKSIQRIANCSCATCRPLRRLWSSSPTITNEVSPHNEYPISELIYDMLPDNHIKKDANDIDRPIVDKTKFSQVTLGDLKKEFNLNPSQEKLLSGKQLMKDVASFTDNEDEVLPNV